MQIIFEQYSKGKSIRSITSYLNKNGYSTREGKPFVTATVRRWIHKPIYKGYYKIEAAGPGKGQEKTPLKETTLVKSVYYPAIVDEELWDRVQDSYKTVHRKHAMQYQYRYSHYELTGILKCYYCKKLERPTGYSHTYSKSRCNDRTYENYVNRVHLKGCKQKFHTFRARVIEKVFRYCYFLVYANMNEVLEMIATVRSEIANDVDKIEDDIRRIDRRIADLTKQESALIDAIK